MGNYLTLVILRLVIGLLATGPNDSTALYIRAMRQHLVGIQTPTIWLVGCEGVRLPHKIGSHLLTPLQEVPVQQRKARGAVVVKILPLKLTHGATIITLADYGFRPPNHLVFTGTEAFYYRYENKSKYYHLVRRESKGF